MMRRSPRPPTAFTARREPPSPGESGYTLVEAVVATALAVVVVGLVMASFLVAARSVSQWRLGLDLENTAHGIRTRLATDLRRAERADLPRPDSLVLWAGEAAPPTTYSVRDSALHRNGLRMHGDALRVRRFVVVLEGGRRDEAGDAVGSTGEAGGGESVSPAPAVAVSAALSDGRRELALSAQAARRTPPGWHRPPPPP